MVSYEEILASNANLTPSTLPRVAVFVGGTSGIGNLTLRALIAAANAAAASNTNPKTNTNSSSNSDSNTNASTNTNSGTTPLRIYLVGRSSASSSSALTQLTADLRPATSTSSPPSTPAESESEAEAEAEAAVELIWLEAEISLLSETQRICAEIRRRETRVDLLFLSAGYAPFGPRRTTSEGLEIAMALEVYSRLLFVLGLREVLVAASSSSSSSGQGEGQGQGQEDQGQGEGEGGKDGGKKRRARVVSVLGGGLESPTSIHDPSDLAFARRPQAFNGLRAQRQYIALHTLGLESLAREVPQVTVLHTWPGWVNTGNVRRGLDRATWSGWALLFVLERLIGWFAMREEEAAQRHLFLCTSERFGGVGVGVGKEGEGKKKKGVNSWGKEGPEGVFLVNYKCECTPNQGVMPKLREKALDKVWEHMQEVLRPYL